jgi:hypothetical protein
MHRALTATVPFWPLLLVANCANDLEDAGKAGASGMGPGTGGATANGGSSTGGSTAGVSTGGSSTGGSTGGSAGGSTTGGTGGGGGGGMTAGGSGGMPSGGMKATGGAAGSGVSGSAGRGTAGAGGSDSVGGAAGQGGGMGGSDAGGKAAGGDGGGAMAGSGGGDTPLTITSEMDGDFDNAFLITACTDTGSGYDCPNRPGGGACSTTPWKWGDTTTSEATGTSYTQVFTVSGGNPDAIYDVTVHVLGQAEGRPFVNGMRQMTANVDPNGTNDLLYIGGEPGTDHNDYNVFMLTITGGTDIPGAPRLYGFNAVDSGHAGNHYNLAVDSTFTFKVRSGMTLTLFDHDSNCIAIKNCGNGGPYNYSSASQCEANARSTPASVTLPSTFRGASISSPAKFQTQFLNFKVMSIVAE